MVNLHGWLPEWEPLSKERVLNCVLMCIAAIGLAIAYTVCFGYIRAHAHDASDPHHAWYNSQEINPSARQRMGIGYKSCCDHADVYKTQFRVGADRADEWWYLREGVWKKIPNDIIKEEDTPDRKPALFINRHTGVELCFFRPHGGI